MKHLATILLLALCATAPAQTIKTLGYNTTNGQVVYTGTNVLTFTNNINFNSSSVTFLVGTNIYFNAADDVVDVLVPLQVEHSLGISFGGTAAAATRTNLGLPWTGLTNTNAANFQGALFEATTTNAPTNTNAPTPDAWLDVTVGTNTYKLPLWQ